MSFEIQAHRGNDQLTLRRLLAGAPSSVEIDVGVAAGEVVIAHDVDFGDASGLLLDAALATPGDTMVVVEAKCFPPSTPSPSEFVATLKPYLAQIALCSFDERVLVEAQRLQPRLETTFLFNEPLRVASAARTLGPRRDVVTRELVEGAHALGLRVVPWTVNDVPTMAALIDFGVDGLVTDEPALAHEVAASRREVAA